MLHSGARARASVEMRSVVGTMMASLVRYPDGSGNMVLVKVAVVEPWFRMSFGQLRDSPCSKKVMFFFFFFFFFDGLYCMYLSMK